MQGHESGDGTAGGKKASSIEIVGSELVLNEPPFLSDHFGVRSTIRFKAANK